ncbi:MAG TPA: VWA domain-containing protein [Enhygromyxa sp.]|nr:VWA domain-containing protein [Enhygromyxa sp.]
MSDRLESDVEPSLETAPEAPASNEQPPAAQPRWRRPALLVAGVSLLTLGAFVNADRLTPDSEPSELADALAEEEAAAGRSNNGTGATGMRRAGFSGPQVAELHKGEEGKMGKPSSKSKSGMYSMKGPANAVPQMARNFDPNAAAGNAGILGVQQGGQYLASPYGGAFAVGNDDEDVWGGLTGQPIGQAYGVGGLGLVGQGYGGGGIGQGQEHRDTTHERYVQLAPNNFVTTAADQKSTFSIDVDTASYANVRRFLLSNQQLPPGSAVRTEELINYFEYDYPQPSGDAPFSLTTEVGPCPWNSAHRLVHVGVQGKILNPGATPARNLVFLIDVSGSMASEDKLGLVKHGLAALTEQLRARDHVSIVVYAGAAGVVLPPTSGADKRTILDALDRLESGGSTNGGEGIEAAYALARQTFVKGGVNRVVLASDGDFNVGISNTDELIRLIEKQRESGVFLSVLGVGTGNYNDHMMEQLADKGNGNYSYIDGMFEARKVLVAEAGATLVTIAKDVKIQVEFDPDQVAAHRLVGYENRVMAHHEFDDDRKDAGEIGAGHSVTAIYEIAPNQQADDDDPLMQLHLRYKKPDGDDSRKISVAVEDDDRELAASSNDYRFAAAVAGFGERLRGSEGPSYAEILALAEGSLGADAQCYRHQFLELVWSAARLSGEQLERPETDCTPVEPNWSRWTGDWAEVEASASEPSRDAIAQQAWQAFVLEVLRLLPPFLALPMFVMAMRQPRRRR